MSTPPSNRLTFICPACRGAVLAPKTLSGAAAPCPKCRADVGAWPEPVEAAPERVRKPASVALPGTVPLWVQVLAVAIASAALLALGIIFSDTTARMGEDEFRSAALEKWSAGTGVVLGSAFVIAAMCVPWFVAPGSRLSGPITWGCWFAFGFAWAGFVLSQFLPIFGPTLGRGLAPFTVAKLSLVTEHVLILGTVGAICGVVFALRAHRPHVSAP